MEDNQAHTNNPTKPQNKEWIQETSLKSWEPELLISGVAIYLTINLPNLLNWLNSFYIYNFVFDSDNKVISLTDLIFAILTSIAYLLSVTFVTHFALRAFWVGLVGLISVYPDGIRYDQITSYSTYYLSQMKKKLGPMDAFILRLDQLCSVLFSISFMFVILLLGVCWMYLVFLLVIGGLQFFLPDDIYKSYELIIFFSLFGVILAYALAISILNLKAFRDHPRLRVWHFRLSWHMSTVFFPFIYRPMSFIIFTFMSHVSRKKLFIYGGMIFVFFYTVLTASLSGNNFNRLFDNRDFYNAKSEINLIQSQNYDNLLEQDEIVNTLTIQSEVVKEDYLRLFIAYPRSLDFQLREFCQEPKVADTLNKYQKRALKTQHNLDCISRFLQIYIDDSLYTSQEFVFYESEKPSKKGMLTFVSIKKLKSGKHLLKIIPIQPKKDMKKEYLYALPFWYMPE